MPLKHNPEEVFSKMVESNYDLLMSTSSEISFELDNDIIENLEKLNKKQGVELEEFIQDTLIKFINQNQLDGTNPLLDLEAKKL